MGNLIKLLPDAVANQIAAGEVVQRPASVVKELLENSVDAEAAKITLIVEESGKSRIQVIDNGSGLSEIDARMAFERHATSKIEKAEDIFSIRSKGFRGEALASIAAVAQVEIKTRRADDELGTKLKIQATEFQGQEPCNVPAGTRIEVANLFYNIPARRNFLKSDQVELRHIIDEFQRVALAHPDIHWEFLHNGHELFRLPPASIRQRIVHIFGKKYDERLVPVQEETPILKISGFIGKPEYARKTRGEQFFFVNNRFIKNGYLHKAVCLAFEGLIAADCHPSYFLFLEVDPARLDINIHPTKTEIKFEDDRAIHSIIRTAVKHALGQFNVSPSLDFETDQQFSQTARRDSPPPRPGIHIDPNFNPFAEQPAGKTATSSRATQPISQQSQQWESLLNQIPEVESEAKKQSSLDWEEKPGKTYLQIAGKFLLTRHGDGLLIIHQNRAHQRILFEKIQRSLEEGRAASQQLLFPEEIDIPAADHALMEKLMPELRAVGFDLEDSGDRILVVKGVPLFLEDHNLKVIVERLLELEKNHGQAASEQQREIMSRELAKVAAIRSGTFLEPEERSKLIDELFSCKSPYLSPEGRPTLLNWNLPALDKFFN